MNATASRTAHDRHPAHPARARAVLRLVPALALAAFAAGTASAGGLTPSPADWRDLVIYQVITDRYTDGNPSNNAVEGQYVPSDGARIHGGDFAGLEQRLDYLQHLGVDALWVSPVVLNANAEYHGYAARDFFSIAPHFGSLADVLVRVLRRTRGRGLLHFIGRDMHRPLNAWIRRRIFPGAYAPTLAEVATKVLEPARMSIVDVENLRLHYARTLAHWSDRFAGIDTRVRERYGEPFRRAWELYLAGSEAAFATGTLQLFQIVFSPSETAPPYWARADIYSGVRPDQSQEPSSRW